MISRLKLNKKEVITDHFKGLFNFHSTTNDPNTDIEKQKYARVCPSLSVPIKKSVDCGKDSLTVERNTMKIPIVKAVIVKRYLGTY
tara:strand:- start:22419 stop:22676 length:258 start_codon:yes stop_codon:yes gene_type:complete